MKPITIWKRFDNRTRSFEHNHIEDRHVPLGQHVPTPRSAEQRRAWQGATWVCFRRWLADDGTIVDGNPVNVLAACLIGANDLDPAAIAAARARADAPPARDEQAPQDPHQQAAGARQGASKEKGDAQQDAAPARHQPA